MFAHLIDHFVFTAKRLTERTKWIVFYVFVFSLVLMFWWFKGFAFGIDGPINDSWGLKWRKVSILPSITFWNVLLTLVLFVYS